LKKNNLDLLSEVQICLEEGANINKQLNTEGWTCRTFRAQTCHFLMQGELDS
jgi:hypothetical protein